MAFQEFNLNICVLITVWIVSDFWHWGWWLWKSCYQTIRRHIHKNIILDNVNCTAQYKYIVKSHLINIERTLFICLFIWPILPIQCRYTCRCTWSHSVTHTHTHTHTHTYTHSLSHKHTHTRYDSSGQGIGPSQRPLPENTKTSNRRTSMARQVSNPQSQEATDRRPTRKNFTSRFIYYPDQQIHNIYFSVTFYISQALPHVSVQLHRLQGVLTYQNTGNTNTGPSRWYMQPPNKTFQVLLIFYRL
jgi:hypothetical protein